jgi:hypothetical protein
MNETCKYKVTESELPGIQGVLSLFFFCLHTHTQISVCFSPPLPCEKLVKNNDTNRHKMKPDDTKIKNRSLFGWLVADGWCWSVLREEYCWLVAGGWFVVREKYCWLVADKPSEQDDYLCVIQRF